MRKKILALVTVAGMLATGIGFLASEAEAQDGPKNLQVLPKDTPKAELKKMMKGIASALGVQCDFCHNLDDMSQDTEHKKIAREMMKMTAAINKDHFAGKPKVGCVTCHNGKKEPKALGGK